MIELKDVKKSFGQTPVLRGVSLQVKRGRTRVILGLSGSGKSVLMKHMIGLLLPDSGSVRVDDEELTEMGPQDLLGVRRKFGMVFQQAALFDSMNVGDNVAFPLFEHERQLGPEAIREKVEETLKMVGLTEAYDKFPSELSGGMRKRVGLARAVIRRPGYILYDEPTTGLDPLTTGTVDAMIMDAQRDLGVTSVVISHDIGSALKVADDIAVIHKGLIVEDCLAADIHQSKHPFVVQFLETWFNRQ